MCLSRAMGSRPVQPAITAWSIPRVSGVVVPWASTVKVRSNTDGPFHSCGKLEDAAIMAARCREHQADRHLALAMAGNRDRAAVDHVDHRGVAQGPHVLL